MLIRITFFTAILSLFSCGQKNKDALTTSEEISSKAAEPDGILIQAQSEVDTLKGSLKAYATGIIGKTSVTINYYSPATRGRMIWGGLVAYNNVWVTGAHKATSIEFDHNVKMGDVDIAAGKYAFFTIPGPEQWTVIINKNWNQHLADNYSESEDLVRLKVTPAVNQPHQERLRYVIESQSDTSGEVSVYWEKLKVTLPFTLTP